MLEIKSQSLTSEHINKWLCYGTTEYSKRSFICKACPSYIDCKKINPKIERGKKSEND